MYHGCYMIFDYWFLYRGFGFIEFKDSKTAEKNLKALQGKKVLGRNITVAHTGEKSENQKVPTKPGRVLMCQIV